MSRMGIGAKIFIDDIGTFSVEFFPTDDVKYQDMINNKQYIAQKVIEQLNKVYRQAEYDLSTTMLSYDDFWGEKIEKMPQIKIGRYYE